MPRPSLAQQKRRDLLPIIARAFAELGYRRVTTAELAARCDVRENILYRLWPDKKAMFIAAIEYVYDMSAATWGRLLAESGSTDGAAAKLLEYESHHHGEFGHYRIIFAGLSETDDPDIRKALRHVYGQFQTFVQAQIKGHRRRGKARKSPDAALAAWAFVGLGTVANICRELGLLNDRDRERLLAEVGRLMLQGAKA